VNRDKQMRLFEGLINSEVSLDQQVHLTREEDQKSILMIGGIRIFLPLNPGEEKFCVADDTTEERHPTVTVREEELEKTLEVAQTEEGDDEHSEEWLTTSQEAEWTATWEFAEGEEEEADNTSFVDLCE
jgi:hypothetical protein